MRGGAPKNTESASDVCTDLLRREILSGAFGDGQRFIIDQISARLGFSHTPIREAVRRLEAEGLLTYRRGRGALVRPLTPGEFEELVTLRQAIEPIALRGAVERATARDKAAARARFDEWLETSDSASMLSAQWTLFREIYRIAEMPRTLEAIDNNWRLIERYHVYAWRTSEEVREQDRNSKLRILACLESGDADAAVTALLDYLTWGGNIVREQVRAAAPADGSSS